jgi:hypothetical protein
VTDIRIPPALEHSDTTDVAVEATYFVIRALRNSARGYERPEISPEGSGPAFEVATLALRQITEAEGEGVRSLSPARVREYIEILERFSNEAYRNSAGGYDTQNAEDLLNALREPRPR